MTSRPGSTFSGTSAFPQPRLNRTLSRLIDHALVVAMRHPQQARAILFSADISATTITRLLSHSGRRRPLKGEITPLPFDR